MSIALCRASAQKVTVSGKVVDEEDNSTVPQATVVLLALPDSAMVVGNVTNNSGLFSVAANPGKYVLRVSFVGYVAQEKNLVLRTKNVNIGTIALKTDAVMLKEAVVTAEAPPVTAVEDTIQYSSSAYRTPQGAMLEELVKKLPGAEVDESGTVKINGKEVKKLYVSGKEFFGGDVKTGLQNIPVDMVDKLKAYDRKSDYTRQTGIDDGEEETVLDLTVKKGMNRGVFGNFDLGIGTKDRYAERGMVNYFTDNTQVSVIGGANNVNDRGFSGGGPGGPRGRSNGQVTTKTAGMNFAKETKKAEFGGSVRYNYRDNDTYSIGSREGFLKSGNTFSNSNSLNRNKTDNLNANFRLEWKPDTMTQILFRPNLSYSKGDSKSSGLSSTFNADPYSIVSDPNAYLEFIEDAAQDPLRAIRVNSSVNDSRTDNNSLSFSANAMITRKLNDKGRNINLNFNIGAGDSENKSYSDNETRYYQLQKDSTNIRRRYITTPSDNWNYSIRASYSEPITKTIFFQVNYRFQYRYTDSKHSTYSLYPTFPDWTLGMPLPTSYEQTYDSELSKDANYKYYNHEVQLGFRVNEKKYRLHAGVRFMPQNTKLNYKKGDFMTDTTRNVFNVAPNLDFQYRYSKTSQLRITYRGNTSQPGMEDLLPIVDNANPLNIRVGNPGLEPSFNHNASLFFNTFNADKQQGIVTHLNASMTQNSISSSTQYDATTGGKITTPKNINGNWNAFGMFIFNTAFRNKKFTMSTMTNARYANNVDFLFNDQTKVDDKNTTTDLSVMERLQFNYRNDWFDFGIHGTINYQWEKSKLQPDQNQEPYTYTYGASTNFNLPWNMSISTNISNMSRRGYTDNSYNNDELVWNAQIAQTFLKGALTISAEWNDILQQQSTVVRSLTANSRSVTQYNTINSYLMFHCIYRLNLFGGKGARQGMRGRGGMGHEMPPGGFGRGGFGGGRRF